MNRDFILPIPEGEATQELLSGTLSLKELVAVARSHKTSDSKKDPLARAGHDRMWIEIM
jgi:hypothetical protein